MPRQRARLLVALSLVLSFLGDARPESAAGEAAVTERTIDLAAEDAGSAILGALKKDQLGNDLQAGDLNADGVADLAIGAHWGSIEGRNNAGRSYVMFGRDPWPSVLDLNVLGTPDWSFIGAGLEPRMGASVATGDLSGDGVDDLILGSLLADPPNPDPGSGGAKLNNAGVVYVMFGGASAGGHVDFLGTPPDALIVGRSDAYSSDQLGTAVATGDLNGDGQLDLVAAALFRDRVTGTVVDKFVGGVFVWWGPFRPAEVRYLSRSPADWTILGPVARSYLGSALAVADINGDGVDDLAVSAFLDPEGPPNSGALYVFHGGPEAGGTVDLATDEADVTIFGRDGSNLGGAVSTGACSCRGQALAIADMTADGTPDLIAGAPLDGQGNAGSVYLIPGPFLVGNHNVTALRHSRLAGTEAGARLGWTVSVGQLDGDSTPDLVVAAPWAAANGRGGAGVVFGLRGPLPAEGELAVGSGGVPIVVLGPGVNSGTAGLTAVFADTDGDGQDDLHLGFPDAAPLDRRSVGTVYVLPGPLLETLATPTTTATATDTATPTASATPTLTATGTATSTATASATPTGTSTSTATDTPSATATDTPTPPRRIYLPHLSRRG